MILLVKKLGFKLQLTIDGDTFIIKDDEHITTFMTDNGTEAISYLSGISSGIQLHATWLITTVKDHR